MPVSLKLCTNEIVVTSFLFRTGLIYLNSVATTL
jgi:hypothetical protein